MNLKNFIPIIAKCHQGQPLKGVKYGGDVLYNKIFNNITNNKAIIIDDEDFNSYLGYNKLYNYCSTIKYPLVLGGDHSLGTSTVLGSVSKYFDNVTVIWIDAHADINTFDMSLSKNRHGMPLSCATGLDNSWFNKDLDIKLKFENIIYVGIRDLDPFEKEVLNKYSIKDFTVDETLNFIKNTDNVIHISFDVDSLDPSILDSTGTMADDGINDKDVKNIIELCLNLNKLIALDIVEFNPELRDVNKSLNTITKIFL